MFARVSTRLCHSTFLCVLVMLCSSACAASPAQDDGAVTMAFVGDVMLDQGPGHFITHGGDPFADVAPLLKGVDIAVANFECAIATKGKKEDKSFTFLGRENSIPVLKRYFSAVSLANNHACDWGKEGFASQLDLFDQQKLPYFGGGRDEQRGPASLDPHAPRPPRRLAGLLRLSAAIVRRRPQDAGHRLDGRSRHARRHQGDPRRQIGRPGGRFPALGAGRDLCAHGRAKVLARKLIDAGADAVMGAHPHVTQTIDIYHGKPIVYSLGNFVFDYFPRDPAIWTGWLVQLTFARSGVDLKTFSVQLDAAGIPHLIPATAAKKGGTAGG